MILRISHHMQFQQKKSNQAVLFVAILLASHFYLRVLHGVQQHNTANSEYIKFIPPATLNVQQQQQRQQQNKINNKVKSK